MINYSKLIFLLLLSIKISAQTVNGWRGADRDGTYPEIGLLDIWPANGSTLVWSVEDAGKGYSSPVISGDKLWVTGMDEDEKNEILTAYTLGGKRIYQVTYGELWNKSYPDTRTTPTIIYNKVYVISGRGKVVCLNANDGEIIWSVDGETFGVETNVWGVSESPLVFDNKVIFTPGGKHTTMVALDASNGKKLWITESLNDPCSHVSPLLITHNGIKQIIGFSEQYLFGVNPETGKIMWKFNQWDFIPDRGMDGICINTPLYRNGRLFVSNAYGMRSHMLELNDDATDVKLLWRNDDLSVHTGGMVVLNDVVYGSNWLNNNNGEWVAIDWNTGKTFYKTKWDGHSKGSVITADNKLFCFEEHRGVVALVRPNTTKFDIVSEFKSGAYWAHPSIHNGMLYIRHGNAVMAYKIK